MKNKKAIFFSTDALIALSIVLIFILMAYYPLQYFQKNSTTGQDVLSILSTLKVGEINNPYVQNLISQGKIKNLDNNILEQIGEFYVTDTSEATALASNVLSSLDIKEDYGLWYETTLIYSQNKTAYENSKEVKTDRRIITGIRQGENVTGYAARAFLSNSKQTKYFFFGGYFGVGKISLNAS